MLRLRTAHSRRLWRAAWSGDEQRFRSRFDAACAKERRNLILEVDPTSGWSAPHFAAVYDRVNMLTEMLDACPDLVEMPNRQGWRPLHLASGFGRRDVIDLLLARGARLDTRNETFRFACCTSTRSGRRPRRSRRSRSCLLYTSPSPRDS